MAWIATGCAPLRYYAHVAHGELKLLSDREPVAAIVADPHADPELRARLRQAQAAREFASAHLDLPRNGSYTSYVELGRPYVTWNVFAAPEFSVDPLTHCFPIAGCVAYRGYFDRAQAEQAARRLAERGDDTHIEGAVAYSTLGWFADPILSSMLRWDDDELDGVIFHELAHQKVYVKDDTAFNESYATFVQQRGLLEWRAARGLAPADTRAHARDQAFVQLVLDLRERLRRLYARDLDAVAMRTAKQDEIAGFRARYASLRDSDWGGNPRHDAWVDASINNAKLIPFGLYERWVRAFARLFHESAEQWPAFHARVGRLAALPAADRARALTALAPGQADLR